MLHDPRTSRLTVASITYRNAAEDDRAVALQLYVIHGFVDDVFLYNGSCTAGWR